jgi:hypothetical protein
MDGTNTLAYFAAASMTEKKSFIQLTLGLENVLEIFEI